MAINRITLLGNVGAEPDVRTMQDGTLVANVRLATTDKAYQTRDGRQVPERTEWHSLILWRSQADLARQYIHKGDRLYVEGKMKSRQYQDKTHPDVQHTRWDVEVERVELLGQRQQAAVAPQGYAPAPPPAPAPAPPAPAPAAPPAPAPAAQPTFTYEQAQRAAAEARQYTQGSIFPQQPAGQPAPPPAPVEAYSEEPPF